MLGQLFKVSLSKLVDERILPYINNPTTLYIKANEACIIRKYGKEILRLNKNEIKSVVLKKGNHPLSISTIRVPTKNKEIVYETKNNIEDFLEINFESSEKTSHRFSTWLKYIFLALFILMGITGLYILYNSYNYRPDIVFSEEDSSFIIDGVPFDFVYVQGGEYMMGNEAGDADERPIHKVILSNFYIGKFEVTQAQWQVVMGDNPSFKMNPDSPVERISWFDATAFLRKLSQLVGKKFRLPTEAEWEYAARGGLYSKNFAFSGSDLLDDVG